MCRQAVEYPPQWNGVAYCVPMPGVCFPCTRKQRNKSCYMGSTKARGGCGLAVYVGLENRKIHIADSQFGAVY